MKEAIAATPADTWEKIKNTLRSSTRRPGKWVSDAEVAVTVFTAFTPKKKAGRISDWFIGTVGETRAPALATATEWV